MVGTALPLLVVTIASFMEKQLSSVLESVENGFGKHLTWYACSRECTCTHTHTHTHTRTRTQTHIDTMMGTETSLALPGKT